MKPHSTKEISGSATTPTILGEQDASRQVKLRVATLRRELKGKFTTWNKGERVNAQCIVGQSYAIYKIKRNRQQGMIVGPGRRREGLECMNGLCGVPRSALEFDLSPKFKRNPSCL